MGVVIAQLLNGAALGGNYALMVTGTNLMLLVARIFHFAYPHVIVMSMYVSWLALRATGDNIPLGILAAIASAVGMSVLTQFFFRRFTERGATIMSIFMALGMAMIITDVQSHAIHGGEPIAFPRTIAGAGLLLSSGLATMSIGQFVTIVGSIVSVVVFFYLLYRTKFGRSMRAMGQSPYMARIMGLPVVRVSILSYVIAGLLGGITSVFLAMSTGMASARLGDSLAVKVVMLAVFAGMGNLKGGIICSFILGFIESLVTGYLPGMWTDAISFGVMLIGIVIRPEGVFGIRV